MDEKLDKDLMELQFRLSSEILKSLPPTNREVLFNLMFIFLYRNRQTPRELSPKEAKRILEKYQGMSM
jgi:hypothetical protein